MTDLELAGAIISLLPEDAQEKLNGTFDRFEASMEQLKPEGPESQTKFCRYMEMCWLTVYNGRYDYCKLQEGNYPKWRKNAENMFVQLRRKAAVA